MSTWVVIAVAVCFLGTVAVVLRSQTLGLTAVLLFTALSMLTVGARMDAFWVLAGAALVIECIVLVRTCCSAMSAPDEPPAEAEGVAE
ncbi:MAG: hypothetical protein ACM31L_05430 [Actinomycetota bacterium]